MYRPICYDHQTPNPEFRSQPSILNVPFVGWWALDVGGPVDGLRLGGSLQFLASRHTS